MASRLRIWVVVALGLALPGLLGCTSSGDDSADPEVAGTVLVREDTSTATFSVRESLEQLHVTDATPGTTLALFHGGESIQSGTTDEQGSLIFRELEAGNDYVLQEVDVDQPETTAALEVRAVEGSTPDQQFYDDQQLVEGFQYIETRDGTTLSANVVLPGPIEEGPYPTVIEYSGYNPSQPSGDILQLLGDDVDLSALGIDPESICAISEALCEVPAQPASMLASFLGYAVVGVNMRGTGCSGGAYDFFEPLQLTDGYDIVETVAAQDWVRHNKVGMVGLSYPGISQLFVAQTQPPSLAAITPLSVIADTARSTLAPGGIFNEGFALAWAENVLNDAQPYGQGWEQEVVDGGDTQCAENQKLRYQNVDAVQKAKENPFYDPEIADPLNPSLFVDDITVPVFMAGAYQDEQTGGHWPTMIPNFTGTDVARFTMYNGLHADGFGPAILPEWKTFLDIYVAEELTPIDPLLPTLAPLLFAGLFGGAAQLPELRFLDYASLEEARAAYEAEPPIRVIFEVGAGASPGAPVGTFELALDEWPPPSTDPLELYFQPDGTLGAEPPAEDGGASQFTFDPARGAITTYEGDNVWGDLDGWNWQPLPEGGATVFVGEPLAEDLVMLGTASADLWIQSTADDADLEVVLTEVRPDGQEVYVQAGWLRASMRAESGDSTDLYPKQTGLEADVAPLPDGEWAQARVLIFPFGHVFRAGSRVRISVDTPGGDQPEWSYMLQDFAEPPVISVAHSAEYPSRVVLPVVTGVSGYPAEYPACPGLRGQPCRDYVEYANTPAE
ncbi:MAG: hypothetical protein JJLCMIEE_03057 [Acidimicrobiales bacterium]|nr:MAG: CocE/NonD family hydrolase [Actinomycetota bacterium]MBV6509941.1 hypothetical protein [Acidimicrobiales bacterium]RIK08569.1 MAG: hypothetical protein DCC48_01100 [Acidobacteriota bacterium]